MQFLRDVRRPSGPTVVLERGGARFAAVSLRHSRTRIGACTDPPRGDQRLPDRRRHLLRRHGPEGLSLLQPLHRRRRHRHLDAAGQGRRRCRWRCGCRSSTCHSCCSATGTSDAPSRSAAPWRSSASPSCIATVHFPDVTHDSLLTAVFGGVFIGAGIGLAVRGGAVLDGTEIAALLIGKRSAVLKVGDVILGFQRRPVPRRDVGPRRRSRRSIRSSPTSPRRGRSTSSCTASRSSPRSRSCRRRREPIRAGHPRRDGPRRHRLRGRGGKSGEDREILYCVVTRLEIGRVHAHHPDASTRPPS